MVNPSFQNFPATPYTGQMPVSPTFPGLPSQGMPGYGHPYMGSSMGTPSMSPSSFGGNLPYIMGQKPPVQSPMGSMMGGMGPTGGMTGYPSTGMPYTTAPKTSGGLSKTGTTSPLSSAGQHMGYPGMSPYGTGMGTSGMGMPGMSPSGTSMGTTGMGLPSMSPSGMQPSYGTGMMPPSSAGMPQSTSPFMPGSQSGMMPSTSSAGAAYGNTGLLGPGIPYGETVPYPRTSSSQASVGTSAVSDKQTVSLYSTPIDPAAYGFPSTDGFRWHVPSQEMTDYSI